MEIYFDDLSLEAQMKLLKAFQTTPEEENWDIFPIAVMKGKLVTKRGLVRNFNHSFIKLGK